METSGSEAHASTVSFAQLTSPLRRCAAPPSDSLALPAPVIATLRSALCCMLCGALLRDSPVAIDTCGHLFCEDCINPVIEYGSKDTTTVWPWREYLHETEEEEEEGVCSVARYDRKRPREGALADTVHKLSPNCCPVCGGTAFKWTLLPVPFIVDFIEALCKEIPTLETLLDGSHPPMASVGSPTEVVQPAGQSVALQSTMDLFAAPQVDLDRAAEPVSMTVETAVPLGQDQTMEAAEEPAPVRHELVLGVSSEGSLLAPPEENGRPEPNAISQMVNNIRSSFSRDTHTDKVTPAASRRLLFETQELSQSVSLPALPPSSEADPRENDFVLVMTPPADTSNPPPLPTKTIEEYMQGWQREKRTPTLGGGWSAMVTLKVETAVSPLTDYLRDTLDRCVGVWVGNALLGDGRTAHATLAPTLLFCRMNGLLLFHQMGSKRVPISELFLSVVRQCDRHPQLSRSVETLYQHILWYGRLPACPWQLGQSYKGSAVLSLPRDWLLWTCRVCRHKLLHGKVSLSQVHGYDESQEESTASVLPYLVSLLGATHLDLSPPLFAILLATALEETTAERSADPLNRVRHFRQLESGSPIPTLYVRGSIHRTTFSSPLYVLLGEGLEEVTSAFCHAVNDDGRKPSLLKMVRTTLKVLVVVFSKLFTAVATSVKDGEMMQLGTAKLCTLTAFIENACGEVESAATLQASQVDLTNNEKSACPTSRGVQQHLLYEDTP